MSEPIESRLRALRLELEHRRGRRDTILAAAERDEAAALEHQANAELAQKATEVIQAAIEARRQELREKVESLVTRGLRAVFGRSDLEFFFETRIHGGTVGIVPALRSRFGDREIEAGIVDGHGGGIADVISFLLRVIVLILTRPKLTPFLVLDEPFRHVSLEYLRGAATLLRELNRSGGIQFFMVTHKPDLLDAADVVYRSSNTDGKTTFAIEHDLRDDIFHQRAAAALKKPTPSVLDTEPTEDLVGRIPGPRAKSGSVLGTATPVAVKVPGDPLSRIQNERESGHGNGSAMWSERKKARWKRDKRRELKREAEGELTDDNVT